MRPPAIVPLLLLLAGCMGPAAQEPAPPAQTSTAGPARLPWEPGVISDLALEVDGERANGYVAVPRSGEPATLVVICHHYGGFALQYLPALRRLLDSGAAGLAMDYRGDADAWKVRAGANDTLAATQHVLGRLPSIQRVLLFGFSMGGEVCGMTLAQAPAGTFDYWFIGAGVMDLGGEWEQVPVFRDAIEAETGGTPASAPRAYQERSPLEWVDAIAQHGTRRVILLHSRADRVVPFDQSERMYEALRTKGVNVSFYETVNGPLEAPILPFHNAGSWDTMWPFVERRLNVTRDPSASAIRGTYEPFTKTAQPADG